MGFPGPGPQCAAHLHRLGTLSLSCCSLRLTSLVCLKSLGCTAIAILWKESSIAICCQMTPAKVSRIWLHGHQSRTSVWKFEPTTFYCEAQSPPHGIPDPAVSYRESHYNLHCADTIHNVHPGSLHIRTPTAYMGCYHQSAHSMITKEWSVIQQYLL